MAALPKADEYGLFHLNIKVTEQVDKRIREEAQKRNITVKDFIVDKATNLEIPNSRKLKNISISYSKEYKERAKVQLEATMMKAEENAREEGEITMNRPNGSSKKTAQFHLRVSQEVYAQIQDRAEEMAMSVSDYVAFVTTQFNIEEVSAKMDKVIEMLEQAKAEKKGE